MSGPAKFSTKFFDVLGRAYDKMKANIKYYVLKEAIENKRKVALEFEVYMRIIEDSDGNDVRVFVKEDKANGLRKDSSFYSDGSWEVFEINHISNEVSLKISSGAISLRKYDSNDRLIENYSIDEKGDTLISEQYEWKNGRLVRMVENGIARNYIYGKTLHDTVRVIPSDYGVREHSGYDKSVGKIPEENDPLYKYFAWDPYRYTFYEKQDYKEQSVSYSASDIFILFKLPTEGTPKFYCPEIKRITYGMPSVECIKYTRGYVVQNANTRFPYPSKGDTLLYGESNAELGTAVYCSCINGKYHLSYEDTTMNEYLQVMKSGWRYNNIKKEWEEYCWTENEMQDTYDHEVKHIRNARAKARKFYGDSFKEKIFDTEDECQKNGRRQFGILIKKWDTWYQDEKKHKGNDWKGTTYGQYRTGVQCLN